MLNRERRFKFFSQSILSSVREMKKDGKISLDDFVIKDLKERALDSYWTNLIERSKRLDNLDIPINEKKRRFKLAAWPEFFKYVITEIGDSYFPDSIKYENGAIYLSRKKFSQMYASLKEAPFEIIQFVQDYSQGDPQN